MGNYNPHAPYILGQEWVPIRDEDLVYSPSVNSVELGTSYTQAASQRVRTARFYTHEIQPTQQFTQVGLVNLYPAGQEALTGPIRQVIIPVNAGLITGANVLLSNATNVADALYTPGDGRYLEFDYNSGTPQDVAFFFAANDYAVLSGKRILNVSLLYAGSIFDKDPSSASQAQIPFIDPDQGSPVTVVRQRNNGGVSITFSGPAFFNNAGALSQLSTVPETASNNPADNQVIGVLNLGDINNFWDATNGPFNTDDRMPWRYVDLQRFEQSAAGASRQHIYLRVQLPATPYTAVIATYPILLLDYMALRVIYCEETRVATGGRKFLYLYGTNQIAMRDITNFTADPVIPAGTYTPTLSWVNPGEVDFGSAANGDFPKLNAIRQAYQIPSHPGVRVNVPFPPERRLGDTFTKETLDILPQLSFHTSGGTMTEPHVYGRQAAAQIYGAITATQEIFDDVTGVDMVYHQVRFIARRFGNTTVPLTLTGANTLSGSSVSITPTDFDQLEEILDGWRKVTLRFAAPPTMGTLATPAPSWIWSATGELAGNRWEIAAASAPAISGIPGTYYTLVPAADRLNSATYGGAQAELNWVPQGVASPWTNVGGDDDATDAVLIFSQDPTTITGLTINTATQAISGFTECAHGPCCLPTAISYNHITWSPPVSSAVLTDFGTRSSVGWGTATTGQVYTDSGGTVPGNYNVVSGTASHTLDGVANVFRFSTVAATVSDSHQEITMSTNVVSAGASIRGGIVGHFVDTSNFDGVDFRLATSGSMEIVIYNVTAGVQTGLTNVSVGTYQAGQQWRCVVDFNGNRIRAKAWIVGTPEPSFYQAEGTALLTVGGYGVRSVRSTGNTNTTAVLSYVDYAVTPSTWNFQAYDLERFDTVTGEWQRIMFATSPGILAFNDYEARVGVQSSYRIRQVNALDFTGLWSVTGSATISAPGVTMPSCGSSKRGVLVFTSNEVQDGSSNLAYAMTWDSQVTESFSFPETNQLDVSTYLDRDYQVAFHGTERGGEQFTRRLLLANAAVALPRLGNMHSIRDLAWHDLAYVCVRDDIGDRWFATIVIPSGEVRRNRRLYNADISVIEVTADASQVDP